MRYIEVIINTPAEKIDEYCEDIAALGASGFVIENEEDFKNFLTDNTQYWDYVDEDLEKSYEGVSRIKFYLNEDDEGKSILASVLAAYPDASWDYTADQDWENSWKDYYRPIETGNKLVVVPQWMDIPEGGRTALRLDPGIAFGTGSHPTTKLCLGAMEEYINPRTKVLDLGCGSGILGIGAMLLGAKECLGVDVDPLSPQAARANADLNDLGEDKIKFLAGDIINDKSLRRNLGGGYELVLANIVSDVIISLSSFVREFMAPDGTFICSGIIDQRADEVKNALLSQGFYIISHTREEEWHCFTVKAKE